MQIAFLPTLAMVVFVARAVAFAITELRCAPVAVEDSEGFHVVNEEADDANHGDAHYTGLFPL